MDLHVATGSDQLVFIPKHYFSLLQNKLSYLGDQLYRAFPFSKMSLEQVSILLKLFSSSQTVTQNKLDRSSVVSFLKPSPILVNKAGA